jgi:Domain of unknown function (DUF4864)
MRRLAASLLAVFAAGVTTQATAFSDADRVAVQGAISQQLKAFLADDGAAAYSFAAPGIKALFPTEEIFMDLVRRGYQPVYRSRSHRFGDLRETAAGLEQIVEIVDAAGEFWTARYTLEKQPDGSWKITSCTLLKKPGEVA